MKQGKLFDVNAVEWQTFKAGMKSCIFKPTTATTIQYSEIQPGVTVDLHQHPAEQILYVQDGYVEASVDGAIQNLGPGNFCYIPSEATHHVTNIGNTATVVIDIFLPERDDRIESKTIMEIKHSW